MGLVRVGIWVLTFRQTRGILQSLARRHYQQTGADPAVVDRIAWAVTVAGRYVPRATCLIQAVTAYLLLNQAGIPARAQIGVRRDSEDRFLAHAWVESGGRVILGGRDAIGFTPLYAIDVNRKDS
jgi:hypothetical protein